MKKLIIIFILALCATMANAQVKVLGKIVPNGPTDTYPTHVDSLGRGGFVAVKTWQERNSIPLPRRKAGMMVSVKSATVDSLYRLGVGLSNADWSSYNPSVDISGKANVNGSNATGTWPISVNGSAMQWGGRTADFSSSSSNVPTHILGFDGINDISRLYQLGAVKTALNISDGSTLSNNIDGSAGNSTNWNGLPRNAGNIPDPSGGIMTLNSNGTSAGYTSVNQMKIALGVDNKANLNGGNNFTGNQNVNGSLSAYSIELGSGGLYASGGVSIEGSAEILGQLNAIANIRGYGDWETEGSVQGRMLRTSPIIEKSSVKVLSSSITPTSGPYSGQLLKGSIGWSPELFDNEEEEEEGTTQLLFPLGVGKKTIATTDNLTAKANLSGGNTFTGANVFNGGINVSDADIYGTTIIEGRNIWMIHNSSGNSARLSVANPSTIGLEVNSADESKRFSLNPNQLSFQDYGNAKYSTITPNQTQANEFVTVELPGKSGTLATTSDIPKMLMVSAISTGSITYSFTHGLSYTPTMVVVTANSDGAIVNGDKSAPLTSSAKINGANIDITIYGTSVAFGENVGPEVGVELKWTIMVK